MSTFQVSGVRNRQRDFDCAAGATVTNLPGSATVYYRDELPIDEDTNDGMIVAGASVSLSGQQYFFVKPVQVNGKDDPLAVAPTANVLVVLVPVPAESAVGSPVVQGVPISNRYPAFNGLSGTSYGGGTCRQEHRAKFTTSRIIVGYWNAYGNPQESNGPNAITVGCSLEYPSGTTPMVGSVGGNLKPSVAPGAYVEFAFDVDIAKGQVFYTRSFVSVTQGSQQFPVGGPLLPGDSSNVATAAVDVTDVTTVPTGGAFNLTFGPAYVLGTAARAPGATQVKQTVVGIAGDSIAYGFYDQKFSLASAGQGFLNRALDAAGLPFYKTAISSDRAAYYLTSHRRTARLDRCNNYVCEYGRNGIGGGATWSQEANNLFTIWGQLAARRPKTIFQTTITPQTSSTDGWATLANQTAISNEAARVLLNDWLRDGAPLGVVTNKIASFEAGITGWLNAENTPVYLQPSGSPATLTQDRTQSPDEAFLKIVTTTTTHTGAISPAIPCTPGKPETVSFDIIGTPTAALTIWLGNADASNATSKTVTMTAGRQRVELTLTPAAGVTSLYVVFQQNSTNARTVYVSPIMSTTTDYSVPYNATSAIVPAAAGTSGATRIGSASHPLTGVWDVADACESSRNSGKWRVDGVRTVTDAAISSASSNLSSATANFTQADVGAGVAITGAGAAGALKTVMLDSVSSGTAAKLGGDTTGTYPQTAGTTVSAANMAIGTPTIDGLHPGPAIHALMAAVVNTGAFIAAEV